MVNVGWIIAYLGNTVLTHCNYNIISNKYQKIAKIAIDRLNIVSVELWIDRDFEK